MAKLYALKKNYYIEQKETLFEVLTSDFEGYIDGIRFEGGLAIKTALRGMKHPHLDGCPYKNFLSNEELDLVANILVPRREIWMVRLSNLYTNRRPNLFYDSVKAMGRGIRFYDGGMQEALAEFASRDFGLCIARQSSSLDDLRKVLEMKSKRVPPEERFFIIKRGVSLDEAMRSCALAQNIHG
jgi:hypothetical protein